MVLAALLIVLAAVAAFVFSPKIKCLRPAAGTRTLVYEVDPDALCRGRKD